MEHNTQKALQDMDKYHEMQRDPLDIAAQLLPYLQTRQAIVKSDIEFQSPGFAEYIAYLNEQIKIILSL